MSQQDISKEELVREEAIAVSQKLFQQYGFNKTTMEDIAKAMGKGKSTLYYYYKSKEEIFEAVINKEIQDFMQKVRSHVDKCDTAEEKLKSYFLFSAKAIKSKVNLYNIVKGELSDSLAFIANLAKKYTVQEIQFIKGILEMGVKNKEFYIPLDLELVSFTIISSYRSIMLELTLYNDSKFPKWEEQVATMVEILFRGIRK